MSMTEYVVPDLVQTKTESAPYDPLNPCPNCGNRQHSAPEGVKVDGTPHWDAEHCFKCGYRPGVNQAVSAEEMARQFAAFKAYIAANTPDHPTLHAPQADEVAQLKAQMAALQDMLAERNSAPQSLPERPQFDQGS